MTTSRNRHWVQPHTAEVRTLPAGRWWDAVRIPRRLGERVLGQLGEDAGAVIDDGYGDIVYLLVRPGTADHWQLDHARVLGDGCHVAIPPQQRAQGPGLHWRVTPTRDRYWTCAERLYAALLSALSGPPAPETAGAPGAPGTPGRHAAGARPALARTCCLCARSTEAAIQVRAAVYACPDCIPHCPVGPARGDSHWD